MIWKVIKLSVFLAASTLLWIIFSLNMISSSNNSADAFTARKFSFTANTSTALSTQTPFTTPQNGSSGDATIPAAWIAFGATILAALVTALIGSLGVAVYQSRRNVRAEKERLAAQMVLERERIHFQDQIDAARADKERQRQRSEMDAEDALNTMNRAKDISERDQAYRQALQADPRIARLQILDMSHPLNVTDVFVRVRLHRDTKPSYELDETLLVAEAQRDPNELLRVTRFHLERRVSTSLEPDEAIRRYKRCVFVGDPGAGKTTMLKYLALKAAEKQLSGLPDLPVHIELNAFASSDYHDLLDYISIRWDDRYGFPRADARAYIQEKLEAGQVLLLLDALDEAVVGNTIDEAEATYKRVADAIRGRTPLNGEVVGN